ncbi:hypothetical protein QVD17_41434 [Tagetes erecta]|uniref:Uncharacterized protein n=1 Tax=Tagetes erecta TaxID=13708 RepID=A0AAD8JKG0_TARER|nr:hypothetical protein QVD17_41434 [Tagetes erecta]
MNTEEICNLTEVLLCRITIVSITVVCTQSSLAHCHRHRLIVTVAKHHCKFYCVQQSLNQLLSLVFVHLISNNFSELYRKNAYAFCIAFKDVCLILGFAIIYAVAVST